MDAIESFLKERYYHQGEDWGGLCDRVASLGRDGTERRRIRNMIHSKRGIPSTPILMNAGNDRPFMSACSFIPVPDNLSGIMDAIKTMALIQKQGGGTGFNFSGLRPNGDIVRGTGGVASGPVSFMFGFNAVADMVKQGGKRRGANMGLMSMYHPDILAFVRCKSTLGVLKNFNISVEADETLLDTIERMIPLVNPRTNEVTGYISNHKLLHEIAFQIWDTGEPGVIFKDNIEAGNPTPHLGEFDGINPCVTGDTLIAVADGRNFVPIKQLAEEENPILVYSFNGKGMIISNAINTRKTQENIEIYKVVLDDGSAIKTTGDHRFTLRDGTYKEVTKLEKGDSLMPFNRWEYRPKGKPTKYWAIGTNEKNRRWLPEHRMALEYHGYDPKFTVAHHKDFNGQNNRIDNLAFLSYEEHDGLHDISGDKNPMRYWWNNASEEEKASYRAKMSKSTSGEHNGRYGKEVSLETRGAISKKATERMKDPARRKQVSVGMSNYYQEHGTGHLKKERVERIIIKCVECGKEIRLTPAQASVRRFCSRACVNKQHKSGGGYTQDEILKAGTDFVNKYGRPPNYPLWDEFSRGEKNIPSREVIRTKIDGFPRFREILSTHNHRVVLVEFVGREDVYNLTVPTYHNYAVVTNPEAKTTKQQHPKHSGIVIANCGEVPLKNYESCVLGSVNLYAHIKHGEIDWKSLDETVSTMVILLNRVIDHNAPPVPEMSKALTLTRRIGVGLMGFADVLFRFGIVYGSYRCISLIHKLTKFISTSAWRQSERLAKAEGVTPAWVLGMPRLRNVSLLSIAPTGSISRIADVSSGMEPVFALSYSLDREQGTEIVVTNRAMRDMGLESPEPWMKTSREISPEDHIKVQAAFQNHVDQAISKTINLPKDISVEDVEYYLRLAHASGLKGVTMFREGCRREGFLKASCVECDEGVCAIDENSFKEGDD